MTHLTLIITLAWRNLWRNKRRTIVILFAMVLGIWAMIFTAAFMRGISIQMLDDMVENLTGHIQIHTPGYLDDPVIQNSFSLNNESLLSSLNNDNITQWSSRLRVPAVLSSEHETKGVTLVGIDAEQESKISFLKSSIIQGHYFKDSTEKGIIIGKKMAADLDTEPGKRIVVMTQGPDNEIADRGFRIIGIYDTPTEAMETGFAFITLPTAEKLLRVSGIRSEIVVITRSFDDVTRTLDHLKQQNPRLDVQAWDSLKPFIKLIVEMYTDYQYIWHLIVFLAMSFGIINTLLMAIFERTREFGLFQALGLKPNFILAQVFVESLLLIILSLIIGNLVSWLSVIATGDGIDVSAFAQGMELAQLSNIIPFIIVQEDLILANLIVITLGMLTSLYPAWKASRLVPANAITRV